VLRSHSFLKRVSLKWITHPALIGLGLAMLCSLSVTGPLISSAHYTVYHLQGSASSLFIAVGLDFCILWICLAGLLWLAGRRQRLLAVVWCVLLASLPYVLLKNLVSLVGDTPSRRSMLGAIVIPVFCVVLPALYLRARGAAVFYKVQGLAATVLGFCSLGGMAVMVQLLWCGWEARGLNATPHLHQREASATGPAAVGARRRVIWVLMDELSYEQVYERRFPGLALPAFDRLAGGATVFTHVVPAANATALAVPSLMTGLAVDGLRVSAEGRLLSLHDRGSASWRSFDPHQTVFQDALNLGDGTGIAGWYNPYCRILPEVLDRCFWTSRLAHQGHMFASRPFEANLAGPLRGFASTTWRYLFHEKQMSSIAVPLTSMHIADYDDLVAAGDTLLSDPSIDFLFLHMPIPHPGGIFDRRLHSYTRVSSSYVDNLALADQYLEHIRQLLERDGEWDGSTIVVMGDHSWRTYLWAGSPEWTAEDEAVNDGHPFDERPAYVVKLAGQQRGARIETPFSAVRTRALLDALLTNQLHTADDLRSWAQANP